MIENISVKIKRLSEHATIPKYQTAGSVGMDLHASEDCEIWSGDTAVISTGIALAVLPGYEAQIRARSGLASKHKVTVLNGIGTIDCDFRGELKVILINHGDRPYSVKRGDRIAQLVFAPVARAEIHESSDLNATARGAGGFGSTGV